MAAENAFATTPGTTTPALELDELQLLDTGDVDPKWASAQFGMDVHCASFSSTNQDNLDGGGGAERDSESMRRLSIDAADGSREYVVKFAPKPLDPNRAELAREATFYQKLAPQLGDLVPRVVYARGDMATGRKIIVMEDLGNGIVSGKLLGPWHPHNWAKRETVEASTAAGPTPEVVIEGTILAAARIHARYWMSEEIQEYDWLALRKEDDRGNWEKMLGWSKMLWTKQREGIEGVVVDPRFAKVVDASFAQMNWDTHLARLQNMCFTLTQGDFHPYNVMWMGDERGPVFIDWEVVSAGSPGQELGQYMVNIDPAMRRNIERPLVESYVRTLVECGVPAADCTFDALWEEYVFGGAAKWIWVLPICIDIFKEPKKQQWFVDQVSSFCADHGVDETNVPQPRKS